MDNSSNLKTVYHVTSLDNWKKIKKQGLKPQIGKLSEKLGEEENAIYTFPSMEEMDNALMNWLGQEYDEMEEELDKRIDLALLEADVSHLNIKPNKSSNGDNFFEQKIHEIISPEYIKLIRIEKSEYESEN